MANYRHEPKHVQGEARLAWFIAPTIRFMEQTTPRLREHERGVHHTYSPSFVIMTLTDERKYHPLPPHTTTISPGEEWCGDGRRGRRLHPSMMLCSRERGRRREEGAALRCYVSVHHRGAQDLSASGARGEKVPVSRKRADLPTEKGKERNQPPLNPRSCLVLPFNA